MKLSYETQIFDYSSKAEGEAHAKEMTKVGWRVRETFEAKDNPLMIEESYSIMFERFH